MIDCIAGYHLNPWTCGIAKFNAILAKYLGVPVVGLRAVELGSHRRPLLSLKLSEFSSADAADLDLWASSRAGQFELFLHAFDGTEVEQRLVAAAAKVYCGNSELFAELQTMRPDIQELFCPGTILNPQRFQRTELSVFTIARRVGYDAEEAFSRAFKRERGVAPSTWRVTTRRERPEIPAT